MLFCLTDCTVTDCVKLLTTLKITTMSICHVHSYQVTRIECKAHGNEFNLTYACILQLLFLTHNLRFFAALVISSCTYKISINYLFGHNLLLVCFVVASNIRVYFTPIKSLGSKQLPLRHHIFTQMKENIFKIFSGTCAPRPC